MTRAAAVILAAGAGVRLGGRNKALLDAGGRTFLEAVLAVAPGERVVVVGPPHGEATAALAEKLGARVVWNPDPARGMLSSIVIGLKALSGTDVALVWPVDHPRVLPATVAMILREAARHLIVVPVFGGHGGHPTAFGAATWDELRAASTARAVVSADPARVVRVPVEDPGVVRDVDRPEDL